MNTSDYKAPHWIPGGHLQTILPAETFPRPDISYRRELWTTPDDDVLAVDWATPEPEGKDVPVMVHFHGLEGSSKSHYAQALMAEVARRGLRGVVIHYRTCGGQDNRKLRAYFSADAKELDWELAKMKSMFPNAPIYCMGVSLGANNLLYWLGTRGDKAREFVKRAVAVCSPLDLVKSNDRISSGFSQVYEWNFVHTLKNKALAKVAKYPNNIDIEKLKAVKTLKDFDDVFTAPIHGYKDAIDYWTQCSSLPKLPGIRVPTLVLNAMNDPIVGKDFLPQENSVSNFVTLEYSPEGGHCGFPQGAFPGSLGFLPERTLEFCLNGH